MNNPIPGLAGYLKWAQEHGESTEAMLETLSHDIMGLARGELVFEPRTHSYWKYIYPTIAARKPLEKRKHNGQIIKCYARRGSLVLFELPQGVQRFGTALEDEKGRRTQCHWFEQYDDAVQDYFNRM